MDATSRRGRRTASQRLQRPPLFPRRQVGVALLCSLCLLGWGASARAVTQSLILSDFVSDGATPPDVTVLDATLDFTLDALFNDLDAGDIILTFSVTNSTLAPNEFNLTEMLFNVPDNVTSASFNVNPGNKWELNFDNVTGGGIMANGFGNFDLQILDAPGKPAIKIGPGSTVDFELTLSGTGIITVDDFVTEFSEASDEFPPMLAAVKFVQGPEDVSAFGAMNIVPAPAVPEPASIALLLAGGSLFLLRRRRESMIGR